MDRRLEIDCEARSLRDGRKVYFEFKGQPAAEGRSGSWFPWTRRRLRDRWHHLLPLGLLLTIGAMVPGFLQTLGLLLIAISLAFVAFILLVQWPIGYLARCWREIRQRDAGRWGRLPHESSRRL